MKKLNCLYCMVILLLLSNTLSAYGENEPFLVDSGSIPEWDESCTYLYGLQITDVYGNILPTAPVDSSYLREGITVDVINGMPISDRCMLIFLLNGHIQPFYIDGNRYDYITFNIEGNTTVTYAVTFKELYIADVETNYLQIVSIGLMDVCPKDEEDAIGNYSVSVTIPFLTDEEINTPIIIEAAQTPLTGEVVKKRCKDFCQLDFFESIDNTQLILPKFIQKCGLQEAIFTLLASGQYDQMQLLVLCDGKPFAEENANLPCFALRYGYGYEYTIDLSDLPLGEHSLCALAFPLYNNSIRMATATKMCITTE